MTCRFRMIAIVQDAVVEAGRRGDGTAEQDACDGRMDAGREECEPGTEAEHEVSGEKFDAQAREHECAREECKADAERGE